MRWMNLLGSIVAVMAGVMAVLGTFVLSIKGPWLSIGCSKPIGLEGAMVALLVVWMACLTTLAFGIALRGLSDVGSAVLDLADKNPTGG
jgi:hypothetical protein